MAFTNVWDDTFPADTQLANLLGSDLRAFRVDVQQRMAAISGLDASKPNFAGDAVPANWNGILFFATDTGKIYKFANPTWTDVSSAFATNGALYRNNALISHTGTTTKDTVYTTPLPSLTVPNTLRVTFAFTVSAQGAGNTQLFLDISGISNFLIFNYNNTPSVAHQFQVEFLMGMISNTTVTFPNRIFDSLGGGTVAPGNGSLGVPDLTTARVLSIQVQNSANSDTQAFKQFMVEVL